LPGVAMPLHLEAKEQTLARLAERAPSSAACLLYAWIPGLDDAERKRALLFGDQIARASQRIVEIGICSHPAGPPICWCRPPLPGMWVSFARRHGIDVRRSILLGT